MTDVKFTFGWYREFLDRLIDHGYTFGQYQSTVPEGTVILRHDVDYSPRKAERLARIEAERDVQATYFIIVNSPLYNPLSREIRKIIESIESYGHRIGLHFDSSQYWHERPSDEKLKIQIETEQRILSEIINDPTDIIAFHNPPDWTLGTDFPGFTHTYESRFFEDIRYVGDSNQRWRNREPFYDGFPEKAQVLTHPVLWGETDRIKNKHLRDEIDYFQERVETALTDAFLDEE